MSHRKILDELNTLVKKTRDGLVPWTSVDENIYHWQKIIDNRTYTTTIQQQCVINDNHMSYNTTLTLRIDNPNETIISLSSKGDPTFSNLLHELFNLSSYSSKKDCADILNKLMEGL